MVTSQKMIESEMGYRGSKSVSFSLACSGTVKEQRVDGSWLLKNNLRCTLMGCESSYQVKIPSKHFYRLYSNSATSNNNNHTKLNPYFVTGFADGESSFSTSIYKNNKLNTGWRVKSFFQIKLNKRDNLVLHQIQDFLVVLVHSVMIQKLMQ